MFDDEYSDDFTDTFGEDLKFEIEGSDVGIPSEIKIVAPEFPEIRVKHDLPETINVKSFLPERIELYQSQPLLHTYEVKIINEKLIPKSINLESKDLPKSIKLDTSDLPEHISLVVPEISNIKIDASDIPDVIRVEGVPDFIDVKMPSEITAKLELPENLEVPLVYKGDPLPIQFDGKNLLGGDDDQPCFALVPCNPKK